MALDQLITVAEQRAAERGGTAPPPPPEILDPVYAKRESPAEGEVLTFVGGRAEWRPSTGGGGGSSAVVVQADEPVGVAVNTLWVEIDAAVPPNIVAVHVAVAA